MSLDDFSFAAPDAGGLATATLSQQRPAPNIGIDLAINNEPGGADFRAAPTSSPAARSQQFKFEYDLTVDPNNGVPATVGITRSCSTWSATATVSRPASTACSTSPPTAT